MKSNSNAKFWIISNQFLIILLINEKNNMHDSISFKLFNYIKNLIHQMHNLKVSEPGQVIMHTSNVNWNEVSMAIIYILISKCKPTLNCISKIVNWITLITNRIPMMKLQAAYVAIYYLIIIIKVQTFNRIII